MAHQKDIQTVEAIHKFLAVSPEARDSVSREYVIQWIAERRLTKNLRCLIPRATRCRWWTEEVLPAKLVAAWWASAVLEHDQD